MLAVSGAHVAYIVLFINFLFKYTHKRRKNIISICFILFFMFLTEFSVSVIRACIMAIFILGGNIFYRKSDFLTNLSLSILILLVANPFCITDIGLLLSYGGTIGIVYFYQPIYNRVSKNRDDVKDCCIYSKVQGLVHRLVESLKQTLCLSISAQIIILPIMLIYFKTITLNFIISSLFASPIFGIIIIFGLFNIFIGYISIQIAKICSVILNFLLQLLLYIAKYSAAIPFSRMFIITPDEIWIILYYIFLFFQIYIFILKNKQLKRIYEARILELYSSMKRNLTKTLAILLICIVLFTFQKYFLEHELKIYFIDVGQGDSTLIITPYGKKVLIDGGGSEDRESFDVGKSTLLPYLLSRKISRIDYILVSHFHADHSQGLEYVIENLNIGMVMIANQPTGSEEYERFLKIVEEKNIKLKILKQGDKIYLDKVTFLDILYPSKKLIQESPLNNNSMVCRLDYRGFGILFTGDIEAAAEKEIIQKYKSTNLLNAAILKVPHHRF